MVCLNGQGERVVPVLTFRGQGRGQVFRDFVRTFFIDGPLYIENLELTSIPHAFKTLVSFSH